jgi:uncharacterized protein YbjQ (UPF0145 family)
MKPILLIALTTSLCCSYAHARDAISNYSVADALSNEKYKTIIGTDIAFYFGNTPYGKPVKKFGEFGTNKKTNAFNKSDVEACQWAFISAMKELKNRALREGGNAVVEIKSNYRNNLTSSDDQFQCGAGAVMAGVALTGKIVQLEK